ncbi:MAG: Bug family tripartite tricarboxylate transporter substrate binding protein [Burkholderiales bacterium]
MKRGILAFALLAAVPAIVVAQGYPTKAIRWIVPYPPGGSFDGFSRVVAAQMSIGLGQPVVVENRVGAGGIIGTEAGVKSAPDGYTLVSGDNGTLVYNTVLYKKLSYDPRKDLEPIGVYARVPLFITANEGTGIKTLQELIDRARKTPGKITHASSGNGSPQHLTMELLKRRAGIDLLHIPYKGAGAAMQDLLAGRVDVSVMPLGSLSASGGKLVPIANADEKRMSTLPDVPTVAESGYPDFAAIAWWMMLVPAGTPPDNIAQLSRELGKALVMPEVMKRAAGFGAESPVPSPEQAKALIERDRAVWAPLITSLGITLD